MGEDLDLGTVVLVCVVMMVIIGNIIIGEPEDEPGNAGSADGKTATPQDGPVEGSAAAHDSNGNGASSPGDEHKHDAAINSKEAMVSPWPKIKTCRQQIATAMVRDCPKIKTCQKQTATAMVRPWQKTKTSGQQIATGTKKERLKKGCSGDGFKSEVAVCISLA